MRKNKTPLLKSQGYTICINQDGIITTPYMWDCMVRLLCLGKSDIHVYVT